MEDIKNEGKVCISCGRKFKSKKSGFINHCSLNCWHGKSIKPKKYNPEYRKKLREKHLQEIRQCKGQPTDRIIKLKYQHYKKSAYDRGHTFSISIEYFASFWGKNCYYCGDKIFGIGIDRFNNSVGYEENNCVPSCVKCNMMKHKQNGDDFIEQCKKIASIHHQPLQIPCHY